MQSKMQHKTPQTQERIRFLLDAVAGHRKNVQVGWVHAYLSICFIFLKTLNFRFFSKDAVGIATPDHTCRHAKNSCVAFQVAVQLRLAEEVLTVRSDM